MEGKNGVTPVVLPAEKGAETDILDILFRFFEFLAHLFEQTFVVFLDGEVDEFLCVRHGFFRIVVHGDLIADRLSLAADMRRFFDVRPYFRLFEFLFEFL